MILCKQTPHCYSQYKLTTMENFLRSFNACIYIILKSEGMSKSEYLWVVDRVSGQDGWILAKFISCMLWESRSIDLQKRPRLISCHLDWTSLANKGFIVLFSRKFFLQDCQQVVPTGQDSTMFPTQAANHSTDFSSSCPFTELGINVGTYMIEASVSIAWSKLELKYNGLMIVVLAPVVQRLDNAIQRINHYPVDSVVCFVNTYPLDSVIQPLNNRGLDFRLSNI